MTDDHLYWYFAYGSNLDPDTFCRRRRMQPRDARCGFLHNYQLTFDLAVGPSNRGVANVTHDPGNKTWGVVYQMTTAQCQQLDRSEGVHRNFYQRSPVTIVVADDEEIEAFTYASKRGQKGRLPSARYLGIIVSGARYHQLPSEWIEQLRAWPLAVDERDQRQSKLF